MSLEELYVAALGDIDCDEYTHSELCYYLVELIYKSLGSRRRLKELQQLLVDVAAAIEEIVGES